MKLFLWQKIWVKNLFFLFFSFLSCFFLLFVLFDISLSASKFSFSSFLPYYLARFGLYLSLFFSVSLLLSLVFFLTKKKNHLEIASLQIAGCSKASLFYPIFILSCTLMALLICHFEWGLPKCAEYLQTKGKTTSERSKKEKRLFTLPLEDGSKLIFEKYDPDLHQILDAFWIKNFHEIYHISSLSTKAKKQGFYVDQFLRNNQGFLEKKNSYKAMPLPSFSLPKKLFFLPAEFQPLSFLYLQTQKKERPFEENPFFLKTHLLHRLASPFILLLIPFSLFPFFLRFQRKKTTFPFYALSLFFFILFQSITNFLLILSENEVVSPFWATIFPYFFTFFCFFWFYPNISRKQMRTTFSLKRKFFLPIL